MYANKMKKLFAKSIPSTLTRKDIEKEDSLAMRARMLNIYLKKKWEKVEHIIGNEFPDDIDLEELVEDLWEDIRLARLQIAMTYDIALDTEERYKED